MRSFTRATGPDGWLSAWADGARLAWAAFYWNGAKTLYRLRGARGRAPCQHPSDSGRQGESFCEACVGLSDPRRFARVCPLIRYDSPRGPRCSVAAADVRPFWGRAAAGLGLIGAGAGLLALAAVLTGFRWVGYQVRPGDLIWPARWHRVRDARADYYARRGVAAYQRGDTRASYLALLEAHHLRPGDYAIDRLLAQLAEPIDPDFADGLFAGLVRSPGAQPAANAAQAWSVSLLARGQFGALAELSAEMLRRGGAGSAPAWTNALIFAARHGAGWAPVAELLARPERLASDCRTALQWSTRPDSDGLDQDLMEAGQRSPSQYLRHYAFGRLIEEGKAVAVLDALTVEVGLPAREMEWLRLSAWGRLGWVQVRRMEIERLLARGEPTSALAELLTAQLILYPDRAAGDALLAALRRHPLPPSPDNYPAYSALACLAGVDRDEADLKWLTSVLGKISGRPFGRQTAATELLLDRNSSQAVAPVLVALQPLPLETMFAMLASYPRIPRAAAH